MDPQSYKSKTQEISSPEGDPSRQAIASLRGYAYQIYASALAWTELADDEYLYLEVAEDYAIATSNAIKAVQVKDTTDPVTINNGGVRSAIDAFVDLVDRNPSKRIQLHYLTTAPIGKERSTEDKINGGSTLEYWKQVTNGADVAPLREILGNINLSRKTKEFIEKRNDEDLRRELISCIHWNCGHRSRRELEELLKSSVIRIGHRELRISPEKSVKYIPSIIFRVLKVILDESERRLDKWNLIHHLDQLQKISINEDQLNQLVDETVKKYIGESAIWHHSRPEIIVQEADTPLPSFLVYRNELVRSLQSKINKDGVAFISGGSGMGKTTLARLCAREIGATWVIINMRGVKTVAELLRYATDELKELECRGVILDDLNSIDDQKNRWVLSQFLKKLREQQVLCLITLYKPPLITTIDELGIDSTSSLSVPYLTEAEVGGLVRIAGGEDSKWTKVVYMVAAFGHPQLVMAAILSLKTNGWPKSELNRFLALNMENSDIEAERQAIRKKIAETVPEDAKSLLFRLSLIIGTFTRHMAISLGSVETRIQRPGEQLDRLIGPWIDQIGQSEYRISPLLNDAGKEVLLHDEQIEVHKLVANTITDETPVDITKLDVALTHGLIGKAEIALTKLAHGIIMASHDVTPILADWFITLRSCKTESPIFPENPKLSRELRFAQFILCVEVDDEELILEVWRALNNELEQEENEQERDNIQIHVLLRALLHEKIAGLLPNWIDLILRFDSILSRNKSYNKTITTIEDDETNSVKHTLIGAMFSIQSMGSRDLKSLARIFDMLEVMTKDQRDRIFENLAKTKGVFDITINQAWKAEFDNSIEVQQLIINQYKRFARQAKDWGNRKLAIVCYNAIIIYLDEHINTSDKALELLNEAEFLLGTNPAFVWARARIYFGQKDYSRALPFFKDLIGVYDFEDSIGETYALRDAAICAAKMTDWDTAAVWFMLARDVAASVNWVGIQPMTIGLRADAAIALHKNGDTTRAIRELATSLKELDTIDTDNTIKGAYCQRIIRHAILWLNRETTGKELSTIEGELVMLPGLCSAPNPKEEIKEMPLGPIELVWYLLVEVEVATGSDAGVETELSSLLPRGKILEMESKLRYLKMVVAIKTIHSKKFIDSLPLYIEARINFHNDKSKSNSWDPMQPNYAEIPKLSNSQLQNDIVIHYANEAVVAFGLNAVLSDNAVSLSLLTEGWEENLGKNYPGSEVVQTLMSNTSTQNDGFTQLSTKISKLTRQKSLNPDELFETSVLFILFAIRPSFKEVLLGSVCLWIKNSWTLVIQNQRFGLQNPIITIPDIEKALESTVDVQGVVRLLLAAEFAVSRRYKLNSELRDHLKSLSL